MDSLEGSKCMSRVVIVTDSTADIPSYLIQRFNIHVIPLKVLFGEEMYLDGVTLTSKQFYDKLKQTSEMPTTSQPSPAEFMNVYTEILNKDPNVKVLSIHLSSEMSGTYQAAVLGKSLLVEEDRVHVIDSKSASYGYGCMVVQAAKWASEGRDLSFIVGELERIRQNRNVYFLVDTLKYLEKGGRIGRASAVLGTLLNIKPVLSIDEEGITYAVDKTRGHRKALLRIVQLLKDQVGERTVDLVIGHTADENTARTCADMLVQHLSINDVMYVSIGAVIGSHVGCGTLAIFVHPPLE